MEIQNNPWIAFKKNLKAHDQFKSYILFEELEIIRAFNNLVTDDNKIHEEILPCPYMGNVHSASVVLLLLNPGYDLEEEGKGFYTKYSDLTLKELTHDNSNLPLPLFSLDDKYKEDSPYL